MNPPNESSCVSLSGRCLATSSCPNKLECRLPQMGLSKHILACQGSCVPITPRLTLLNAAPTRPPCKPWPDVTWRMPRLHLTLRRALTQPSPVPCKPYPLSALSLPIEVPPKPSPCRLRHSWSRLCPVAPVALHETPIARYLYPIRYRWETIV